jgi:prepilin-type N-terminal cleavage/methylation domain-containing protein
MNRLRAERIAALSLKVDLRSRLRDDRGFTLLEMLVAIAILAVLVGIVPRTLVFARSIMDHSRDWMDARFVAETVLNDQLVGPALAVGTRSGEVDGRRWRTTLKRHTATRPEDAESGRVLLDVRIEVDVGAGRILEIETMRIGGAS